MQCQRDPVFLAWPGAGWDTRLTSSMTEESFPWWSRRLGAGAGRCPVGPFSSAPCSPPCCRPGRLHFPGNSRAVQLLGRLVSAAQSRSPHVGCRYRIHTWGLLAQLVPQAACSWDEQGWGSPPGARGRGMSQWGGGGGQFVSPVFLRGCPFQIGSFLTHRLPRTGGNRGPHGHDLVCSERRSM